MNMKALKIATLAGCLLFAVVDISACAGAGDPVKGFDPAKGSDSVRGFAVVELFTSEGCSSCLPADQLMARIQQESKGQPLYILAFHVDYWNRLGWKDIYSDAAYSQRQNQYAAWLRLQSVYTPQVVVNGSKEFVGSQESTIRKAIGDGMQKVSPAQLTLADVRLDKGKVAWRYQARNAGHNTSLVVAIVQRSATSQVKAGENSGRTLSHVQIVRQLQTVKVDADGSGAGHLSLPAGVGTSDEEIIAFLQDDDNGQIVAVTRAALP